MKVRRIVSNLAVTEADIDKATAFYEQVLGLDVIMDHGWFKTLGTDATMRVQLGFGTEGGSDTPVPDLSIEVDDLDMALERIRKSGTPVEYGPCSEPWGVRRFHVRDPLGRLLNILQHE